MLLFFKLYSRTLAATRAEFLHTLDMLFPALACLILLVEAESGDAGAINSTVAGENGALTSGHSGRILHRKRLGASDGAPRIDN